MYKIVITLNSISSLFKTYFGFIIHKNNQTFSITFLWCYPSFLSSHSSLIFFKIYKFVFGFRLFIFYLFLSDFSSRAVHFRKPLRSSRPTQASLIASLPQTASIFVLLFISFPTYLKCL